ncbi:hypothetical protein Leryth_000023 [Lithospermum erythrorhizon]|nr:hypothetical protein Leryth_000023 [Lithospermum erythrorhizon]
MEMVMTLLVLHSHLGQGPAKELVHPPTMASTTGTTSAANVSAAAVQESSFIGGLVSDSDSIDSERLIGLPLTTPSTTVRTSAANVSAAAVQKNGFIGDLLLDDYSEDMEGLDEEPDQSEGKEESEQEGSEQEGSYDGERDEEREDREYRIDQEDEGSEEVDDINQGPIIGAGDTVRNDVSYDNTAGSLGNKSSMVGTFTDQDVLDCPICYEALTIPVYQCENGHIACASCCFRIGYKCPSCSQRIGTIRCRSIERIINSVKFVCPNLEYGCKETMFYNKREAHGKACIFAPCSCPLESCDYVGSAKNLYAHFRGKHFSSASRFNYKDPLEFFLDIDEPRTVILQEKTDGRIFILNHVDGPFPHAINLICIAASQHPMKEFYYELSVDYQYAILTLKTVAATMKKWSGSRPLPRSLLVPFDFTYDGSISV